MRMDNIVTAVLLLVAIGFSCLISIRFFDWVLSGVFR